VAQAGDHHGRAYRCAFRAPQVLQRDFYIVRLGDPSRARGRSRGAVAITF
jgi:hypothetical protein